MAIVTPIDMKQHPFLTGKAKRLFIDGKWVEAASGKTFETVNPSTARFSLRSPRATRKILTAP